MEVNKIYNEDCLVTMMQMPENFVDLVVTSPPYDDLRKYTEYRFDYHKTFTALFRCVKSGGVVVWVVNDSTRNGSETGTSFRQALYAMEIGFRLHDTMIYRKLNPMPVKSNRYLPCFEYMFVFSKGKPKTTNLIMERTTSTGKEKYTGTQQEYGKFTRYGQKRNLYRHRYNVWEYKVGSNQSTKDKIAHQHPAIFPEQLVHDHVITWSNESDLVYDPFMGSGTTAKVAKKLKRSYIGSEIEKQYCLIAEQRLSSD